MVFDRCHLPKVYELHLMEYTLRFRKETYDNMESTDGDHGTDDNGDGDTNNLMMNDSDGGTHDDSTINVIVALISIHSKTAVSLIRNEKNVQDK